MSPRVSQFDVGRQHTEPLQANFFDIMPISRRVGSTYIRAPNTADREPPQPQHLFPRGIPRVQCRATKKSEYGVQCTCTDATRNALRVGCVGVADAVQPAVDDESETSASAGGRWSKATEGVW